MKLHTILEDATSDINRIIKEIALCKKDYFDDKEIIKKIAKQPAIRPFLEAIAEILYEADPTTNKKFLPYIINLYNKDYVTIATYSDRRLGIYSFKSYCEKLPQEILQNTNITQLYSAHNYFVEGSNRQLYLKEDIETIRNRLTQIDRYKEALANATWDDGTKVDLNLVGKDYFYLYRLCEKIDMIKGVRRGGGGYMQENYPGAEVIYDQAPYRVYKVLGFERSSDTALSIQALQDLGLGTDWCTRKDYKPPQTKRYLQASDVFVVFKDNKPFIQCNFGFNTADEIDENILDTRDQPIAMPQVLWKPIIAACSPEDQVVARFMFNTEGEDLTPRNLAETLETQVEEAEMDGGQFNGAAFGSVYLKRILSSAGYEGMTANDEMRDKLPSAKKFLLQLASYSEQRIPVLEKILVDDRAASRSYDAQWQLLTSPVQNDILKYVSNAPDLEPLEEKWPAGAEKLCESPIYAARYAMKVLRKRWEWAEEQGVFDVTEDLMDNEKKYIEDYKRAFGV